MLRESKLTPKFTKKMVPKWLPKWFKKWPPNDSKKWIKKWSKMGTQKWSKKWSSFTKGDFVAPRNRGPSLNDPKVQCRLRLRVRVDELSSCVRSSPLCGAVGFLMKQYFTKIERVWKTILFGRFFLLAPHFGWSFVGSFFEGSFFESFWWGGGAFFD